MSVAPSSVPGRSAAACGAGIEDGEIEEAIQLVLHALHRLLIEAVVDPACVKLLAPLHEQAGATQHAKVMTGHALRHAEQRFQVADTQFALGEQPEDAQARRIGDRLEQLRKVAEPRLSRSDLRQFY